MTPIHTVSVSYVTCSTVKESLTVPLVFMCNSSVMVCWFADMQMAHYLPIQMDNKTPLVDLATKPMACHLPVVLLALQASGSTPCQLVLPSDQTAPDQM